MTLDLMSESGLLQLQQYSNTNPYRKYVMNKPYIPKKFPISTHSHRLNHQNQPSYIAFNQSLTNQKSPLTLDRIAYKLRMKSDLNVNTLREPHIRQRRPRHNYPRHQPNPNINDTFSTIPPSITTKSSIRQPTASTMKTFINDELNGIEGNAVRVGTLDDLIKQFHNAEFRLVRHRADYADSASTYLSNNILTNERIIAKPLSERVIKQPQALTEYHFNAPTLPCTPSQAYRTREKIDYIDLHLLTDQHRQRLNSFERQPTGINPHDKRLREKSSIHTDKQVCVCNKLNIIDPFNSEENELTLSQTQQVSTRYIFPPIRPFGYLTRKTVDDIRPVKKKHEIKKKQQIMRKENSLDSLDQLPHDEDDNSQFYNHILKSTVSLTDLDDDLQNPPNTRINLDLNNYAKQ